ncbi:survival motor neuron protein 1-like [Tyto alba]|uniref:survival motor neuron protein 1-like n=1 Tax=Tyto alba TaxID=56313 RepID=UPI001C684D3D|nr:survival motor neuron protein 1-like [Tyto alba]
MAEGAPGPRGPDLRAGGASSAKATIPLRSPRASLPRDAPVEGSDGDSDTPTSSVTPSEEEEEEEEEEGHQWKVGDACSTPWSGDGRLYPAHLRALDPATGTCLVEFDGYGNTEERALADLLPPRPGAWGGSDTPGGEGPPSSWEPRPGARRRRKGERVPYSPQPPEVMPPPWPPAPPHALREEEEEEDALAAMLMAWYMSGYHTGFYVGLREGRAEAPKPPPKPGRRQKQPPQS